MIRLGFWPSNPPAASPHVGSAPSTSSSTIHPEADNMEAEREGGISQEQLEYVDLPDFTDFNKHKEEHCFEADQIWSVYDTLDRMPRFYVHIRKVYYSSSGTFTLLITGLEPEPENSMERIWVKQGLPVACGKFVHGETEEINNRFICSRLMAYKIGNPSNFSYVIYPKKGEIWAIFQDWNINKWSFHPKSHMKFKFDIVEVLSDFDKESGLVVAYMEKVEGFVSLFQRTSCAEFRVQASELFRFSHCIPSSKMTGNERADVLVGSYELDTASLPEDLDQFYFSNNGKVKPQNVPAQISPSCSQGKKNDFDMELHTLPGDHQSGQPTQYGHAGMQNMNPGSKTSRPVSSQQEVVGRKGNAKVRSQRDEPSFSHFLTGEETAIDIGIQQSAQLPHSGYAGMQNLNPRSIMDQPASFQKDKAKCKEPAKPAVQKPQNHQENQNSHAGMQFGAPKLEMEKKRANTWNNFTKAKKEKFTFEERIKMWKKMDAAEKKEYA